MTVNLKSSFTEGEYSFIPFQELTPAWSEQMRLGRNHPDVRRASVNRDEISRERHAKFVDSLRSRDNTFYFMVRHMPSGINIGSVNLHLLTPTSAERGIWLFAEYRGSGHAHALLSSLYRFLRRCGVRRVVTSVRTDNPASHALEHALGARESGRDNDFVHYELLL